MNTTIKTIMNLEIFQSYEVLSAKNDLEKPFESISILETPDFENYIIEKSLILTTFYPIKGDQDKFEKLMYTLAKKNTAAIVIKLKRYINQIPESIIALSNSLHLPIIALNYDANLSLLFNNILSELQRKDYYDASFTQNYSQFLKEVYETPTTKTLLQIIDKIEDLDILIYNLDNKKTYYSDKDLLSYFNQYNTSSNLFHRVDQVLYYTEDVIYDDQPIYKILFRAKNDRRHILHSYIEIFKLMVIVIYQKKIENTLKQNQFLLNFVSNLASNYSNNQLIEATKRYKWNIQFPITMMLFSIKDKATSKVITNPNLIEYIRQVIINKFHVQSDELRYTWLNDQLLFIINTYETIRLDDTVKNVYTLLENKYPEFMIQITYSSLITEASLIPQTYTQLSEALIHIENQKLGLNIFSESQVKLLNLLKNLNYNDMAKYINDRLKPIYTYDQKHQSQLIETLFAYIESKFNIKKTAEKLFIHYNSVRYRLEVLDSLGLNINDSKSFFDIYFALYLHISFDVKIS